MFQRFREKQVNLCTFVPSPTPPQQKRTWSWNICTSSRTFTPKLWLTASYAINREWSPIPCNKLWMVPHPIQYIVVVNSPSPQTTVPCLYRCRLLMIPLHAVNYKWLQTGYYARKLIMNVSPLIINYEWSLAQCSKFSILRIEYLLRGQ